MIDDIIAGFDTRRQAYRKEEQAKADQEDRLQFGILSTLAQHTDPELARVGATGLLELAAGGRKPQKGLGGFLGEVQKSNFWPTLQAAFAQPQTPQPGSAALPDSSPVEPSRQAQGPPSGATSPQGQMVRVSTPELPGMPPIDTAAPPGLPGMDEGGGGPPDLLASSAGPGALPPPAPETPQAKSKRLYPTAGELAGEQAYQQLAGRIRAVLQGLQGARSPAEANIIAGVAGAPQRASQNRVMNARYRGANGQEFTGAVVFDPLTGVAEVDGVPVTVLQQLPTTPPRPIRGPNMNTGGTITTPYLDPYDLSVVGTFATGMPVPEPPSQYTGGPTTLTGPGGQPVVGRPTRTGFEEMPGYQPPPSRTPQVNAEAQGWLAAVDREAASRSAPQYPGAPKRVPNVAQLDAIVKQQTGGRFQSYAELQTAARSKVTPGQESVQDQDYKSRANRVFQRLQSGRPGTVQGSVPPGGIP